MNRWQMIDFIKKRGSYLCVGLDTAMEKIPRHLLGVADPVFEFNKAIIDATLDYCVSYKINTAFYEARGLKGWESMEKTVNYIPSTHLRIADAKRGDIGNTSAQYALAFFNTLPFDAITVAPYMGEDSIRPFLEFEDKWTIVLGLTSNPGAADFELQRTAEGYLYEQVIKTVCQWGSPQNLMFVVGATQASMIEQIRRIAPEHFFLVPGVGAQGGDLFEISHKGLNTDGGLLINASRSVIYASSDEDFAIRAGEQAKLLQQQMLSCLQQKGIL